MTVDILIIGSVHELVYRVRKYTQKVRVRNIDQWVSRKWQGRYCENKWGTYFVQSTAARAFDGCLRSNAKACAIRERRAGT